MEQTAIAEAGEPAPTRRTARWRPILAWTAVACWGAWALFRLLGAERLPGVGYPGTPLVSFTPYAAATALVPVVCAALLRHWWALVAGVVVFLAFMVAVTPRAVAGGQPSARGPALRVLTANMYFGEAAPERIVDLVRRHAADVLSLQELTPSAVERLRAAGLERLLPYKAVDVEDGAAGTGLYARYPLRALPAMPDTVMAMPRAEFTLPGGHRVDVTAVHPPPPIARPSVREWEHDLRVLPSAAGDDGPTRILAGDFNATLDHARLREVLSRGYADAADRAGEGLVHTWGARNGVLTIDHILVDTRAAVRKVKVHDLPGSDHRAVFAELRLP